MRQVSICSGSPQGLCPASWTQSCSLSEAHQPKCGLPPAIENRCDTVVGCVGPPQVIGTANNASGTSAAWLDAGHGIVATDDRDFLVFDVRSAARKTTQTHLLDAGGWHCHVSRQFST